MVSKRKTIILVMAGVFLLACAGFKAFIGVWPELHIFGRNSAVEIRTLENGKKVLYVDSNPFQTYGVQVRVDTWRRYAGYTNKELSEKGLLKWAKELNANCVQVPVYWGDCEPEEDSYNWENVDWILSECEKYGLKLELLWFGSDVCGSGWSSTLPDYIINNPEKYPRVLKSDGTVVGADYANGDGQKITLCREDPDLIRSEQKVLGKLMEYLEARDAKNTVIGMQIENEPSIVQHGHPVMNQTDRCYCKICEAIYQNGNYKNGLEFSKERLAIYLNNIAEPVKKAQKKIYTRVNFITAYDLIDESIEKVRTLAPNIDFISYDNYNKTQAYNYQVLSKEFTKYGNIPHVAEQQGAATDCRQKIMDALTANGCGSEVYRLAEAVPGTDNFLLDGNGRDAQKHTQEVRKTFEMLNGVMVPLAVKKNGSSNQVQYFNCMGTTSNKYHSTKKLSDIEVSYGTEDKGIGVAFIEKGTITLLSAEPGQFEINIGSSTVKNCETGYYDKKGTWITKDRKTYSNTGNSILVKLEGYEIVRITKKNE